MARIHEHQGKAILAAHGIAVPRSGVASTADEAHAIATDLGGPVVVKIQAWTTGRAKIGGVALVDTPDEARQAAERMLGMTVGAFPVETVLVEEQVSIDRELFVSLSIDDAARGPVMLLSFEGGSGIEDRAGGVARLAVDATDGPDAAALDSALTHAGFEGRLKADIAAVVNGAFAAAKAVEARSVEINPIAITTDGRVVAADCRMTIDDYAVFRHPELGIEIARELDHPPTELERIAYDIEQRDHRGTFYFARLPHEIGDPKLVGFHGAGGGGSMMSMDAVSREGFTLANFTDTSGNPSAAKVYAAARIILSQPGLVGYFGSGSGVASQEQFWSAYGLAKAFNEVNLNIPALIRLGGNSEDRAVEVLQDSCRGLPATVEGYKKDDTPGFCGSRFKHLVEQAGTTPATSPDGFKRSLPGFAKAGSGATSIPFKLGTLWIDSANCDEAATKAVIEHGSGLFVEKDGKPALAVEPSELDSKDSELIMCEIECLRAGRPVVFVDLPIEGLDTPPPSAEPSGKGAA